MAAQLSQAMPMTEMEYLWSDTHTNICKISSSIKKKIIFICYVFLFSLTVLDRKIQDVTCVVQEMRMVKQTLLLKF